MAALTVFLFSGATAPQQCTPAPQSSSSDAGILAAGVGVLAVVAVGTVVLVEVHKGHHQVKGCVSKGPGGFQARTDEGRVWTLSGDVAGLKPGDLVKVQGNRVSRTKAAVPVAAGERMFFVESLKKDYGACKLAPGAPAQTAGN